MADKTKTIDERLEALENNVRDLTAFVYAFFNATHKGNTGGGAPKRSVRTDKLELVHTKTGSYYLPKDAHADIIAITIKKDEIFEPHIYMTARKFIRENSIVLDLGSNFGQMALLMSRYVGEKGFVYAFEADDFVYSILEKNIAINNARIKPHFGAVHSKGGETLHFPVQDFERFGTYGSYGIDYIGGKGRPVPTIAIDDLEFPLPISFMKIDVQGGDLFAMQGAVETIQKHRMPVLFEYEKAFEKEQGYSFEQYLDFIKSIGYRIEAEVGESNYLILPDK